MLERGTSAIALAILFTGPALAVDWGYDQGTGEPEVKPLRANALPMGKAQAKTKAPTSAAPRMVPNTGKKRVQPPTIQAAAHPTNRSAQSTELGVLKEAWLQIFELASASKLDDEQRSELFKLVDDKLKGTPADHQEALSVLAFWPKLTGYLLAHPEQKDNYAVLLRALLRWKARSDADHPGVAADESNLIAQALGPLRLSVPGTVPFSEEAVNAYADMACFIYEQRNPGKSVDALDNRAVFATVVSEKFRNAPTKRDQEAMAGFDLSWAKFKIVYTQADAKQKAILLSSLMKSGAAAAWSEVKDPILELVLHNWPGSHSKTAAPVSSTEADRRK